MHAYIGYNVVSPIDTSRFLSNNLLHRLDTSIAGV